MPDPPKKRPALRRVLAALDDEGREFVATYTGGYMAQCPAHDDTTPSLSIKPSEDGVLVHCFAGCEPAEVVAGMGLRLGDLYDVRVGEEADPTAVSGSTARDDEADEGLTPLDWRAIWSSAEDGSDWIVYPLVETARATTLVSPAGQGKSLLSLEIGAGLASGKPAVGQPMEPADVVYVDWENDQSLVVSRAIKMGYGPEDLDRLHYYSFPDLDGLDTKAGARELLRLVDKHGAKLVVIDTYGTSTEGEENSADTARAFARRLIGPLKARGVALLRLDHTGKDVGRGERGSSGKRDQTDYTFLMTEMTPNVFRFQTLKNRTGKAPRDFIVNRFDEPHLHHKIDPSSVDAATPVTRIMKAMDAIGLPLNAGRRAAREAGIKGKAAYIDEALMLRRERAEENGDG